MVAKYELRRRRGATLALALLVGLAGGVVLGALAGASRTDTAMDRFVSYNRPENLFAIVDMPDRPPDAVLAARAKLIALPQVAAATRTPYMFLSPDRAGAEVGSINAFAAADDAAYHTMGRP